MRPRDAGPLPHRKARSHGHSARPQGGDCPLRVLRALRGTAFRFSLCPLFLLRVLCVAALDVSRRDTRRALISPFVTFAFPSRPSRRSFSVFSNALLRDLLSNVQSPISVCRIRLQSGGQTSENLNRAGSRRRPAGGRPNLAKWILCNGWGMKRRRMELLARAPGFTRGLFGIARVATLAAVFGLPGTCDAVLHTETAPPQTAPREAAEAARTGAPLAAGGGLWHGAAVLFSGGTVSLGAYVVCRRRRDKCGDSGGHLRLETEATSECGREISVLVENNGDLVAAVLREWIEGRR